MTVHQLLTVVKAAQTSTPTVVRLCIHCKHCDIVDEDIIRCFHPENLSMVDGMPAYEIGRFRAKLCKGKFWEAKPLKALSTRPWWKFWKGEE